MSKTRYPKISKGSILNTKEKTGIRKTRAMESNVMNVRSLSTFKTYVPTLSGNKIRGAQKPF